MPIFTSLRSILNEIYAIKNVFLRTNIRLRYLDIPFNMRFFHTYLSYTKTLFSLQQTRHSVTVTGKAKSVRLKSVEMAGKAHFRRQTFHELNLIN